MTIISGISWFQFLIGRLKTKTLKQNIFSSKQVSIPYRQAKNFSCPGNSINEWTFQFLIGRLKTSSFVMTSSLFFCVSIPYRQAKNPESWKGLHYFELEFQFLIGRLKTVTQLLSCFTRFLFQFLIGRLKTRMKKQIKVDSVESFNSLQVG